MLLALRQERKAALQQEIERLQQRLSADNTAAAAAAGGGGRCSKLYDKQQKQHENGDGSAGDVLVKWIKDNGGQVCSVAQ
jgi:hypothetical protein